jgi:hypothetical protein
VGFVWAWAFVTARIPAVTTTTVPTTAADHIVLRNGVPSAGVEGW